MAIRTKKQKTIQNNMAKKAAVVGVPLATFVIIGSIILARSYAAGAIISAETESGTITTPAVSVSDSSASASRAVRFAPPAVTSKYRNGTYTVNCTFPAPTVPPYDTMRVTLTILNDLVVNSSIVNTSTDGTNKYYVDMFDASYKPLVIGQPLATLQLGKVSIASLVPIGFNDAVVQIRALAATGL